MTRGLRIAQRSIIARVRSLDPPSTQICSTPKLTCCRATEASVRSIVAAAFRLTVTIESRRSMDRHIYTGPLAMHSLISFRDSKHKPTSCDYVIVGTVHESLSRGSHMTVPYRRHVYFACVALAFACNYVLGKDIAW